MPLSKNAGGRHRTPSLKLSSDWTAFFPAAQRSGGHHFAAPNFGGFAFHSAVRRLSSASRSGVIVFDFGARLGDNAVRRYARLRMLLMCRASSSDPTTRGRPCACARPRAQPASVRAA